MVMIRTANGMLRSGTPVEDYTSQFGLWVKREDLACPPPGPPFSKTRGVYARVASRPEKIIGVLDTYHSQAGHAVARACQILGKECINYYPLLNKDNPAYLRDPQYRAQALGASIVPLPAGRSCILYHKAKKDCESRGGYMMPNALKLHESVTETAKEYPTSRFGTVIIPASSGTIAAGVLRGWKDRFPNDYAQSITTFVIHLGYSRSHEEVRRYVLEEAGITKAPTVDIIDEGYAYKDRSRPGINPLWPCNEYYDLKAFRWFVSSALTYPEPILLWNIG